MNTSLVERAARNNAIWCDSVCRAHGIPGEFFPTVWLNRGAPPPYHSNLVVLSGARDADQNETLDHIHALMTLPLPPRWSVKDSFFNLDLAPLGFEVLFEATWIWRLPGSQKPVSPSARKLRNLPQVRAKDTDPRGRPAGRSLRWSRISSSIKLTRWEAAWSSDSRNSDTLGRPAHFPVSLLDDPNIAFFAGTQGTEIVAGGIANRTGDVVGLSNIFATRGEAVEVWNGLVGNTWKVFPDLPQVGYERGPDLAAALKCGFTPIGSLRVWIRRN
jgi:hypothetical protein